MVAPKGAVWICNLLQWKLFSDVFQQLLKCLVFSEVPKPGKLVQVAGYVFIQGTTHPLQLFLDQGPHAFDGIGVSTTVGVNKVLGMKWVYYASKPIGNRICCFNKTIIIIIVSSSNFL